MAWLECHHTIRKTRSVCSLRKVLTTIGSAPGNDLVLEDPTITASHASVMRQGQQWSIGTNDRNGVLYVNGQRTRRAVLTPGDQILLGGWRVSFQEGEPTLDDAEEEVRLTLLEQLVQLSADMMRDTTPARLFSTLLQGLVTLTRAEKGFIILFKDGERHLAASHNTGRGDLDLSRVSDSIIDKVVDTLQPLIVSDALHDTRFGRARSVVDLELSSVMCVPLIHQSDLLGVIYLGNDAVTDLFTERDLTVLKIYASQASIVVFHALLLNQLKIDNEALRAQLDKGEHGELIGSSPSMKAVYKVVRKVAPTDLSLLVLGETGTGKELIARQCHQLSGRADGPFVAINCGAIPENLLESELFGHKKGAFTGADADKIGRIEAASGGTLFLDEIGEMPMNLQVKLLRVLQERHIERVGDVKPRPVDIRVVAATNRDPAEMITAGAFREDLYYRLNEVAVTLPPLRDRGEDIVLLAQYFLRKYVEQYSGKAKGFTNQALVSLRAYYWPGNVRQLENTIKKAVIMSDRALLNADDLGLPDTSKRHILPLTDAQEQFKADYIRKVLDLNNWNKAQTARDLGVDARTIFRYIEKIEADQ
ncbi:MAG: sigma 54-interacting transcriptional regulator [Alphaproteobacteria bacterium]|nr:sigma 54-interacting transcriptional regulator [Alphaproteobacteria bacterium]